MNFRRKLAGEDRLLPLGRAHQHPAILKSGEQGSDESPCDAAGYAGITISVHGGRCGRGLSEADATGAKAMTSRTDARYATTSGPRAYYEIKYRGPDGQELDVTETGWIGTD